MAAMRLAVVVVSLVLHATNADFTSASSSAVAWSGRYAVQADGSVSMDWQGVAASFQVVGQNATVSLYANCTLPWGRGKVTVYVNDYAASELFVIAGTPRYLLAAGLPSAVNNVTVAYTLEPLLALASPSAFMNFFAFEVQSVDGSAHFLPAVPLSRRIDIIGDSISAGSMTDRLEGVNAPLSMNEGCAPWAPVTGYSHAQTWEAISCRYLRANCTTTAWSGRCLAKTSKGATLPALYPFTFASHQGVAWGFTQSRRPDAVLVHLGTNDYGSPPVDDAFFTATYVAFMRNITAFYAASPGPSTIQFFAAIGHMSPTLPLNATLAAIAQARAEGIAATLLDLRNATTLDGCGGHPGVIGHFEIAQLAVAQISAVLGW